ncbi:DUF4148 domain-containing protein [Noviherbaspirillum sp. ST9]|uniref:DUF4148 domain-containing protein n=1 Tax=Noviherbaspirillum sp. ST9 TaxID=3401606 RepID=UPI003B587BF5
MNAKQILAALAVFAATGTAFAADNGIFVEHTNVPSNKTRAEVRAELEQAASTERVAGTSEFVEHAQVASTRSREEVRGEAVQAARNQTGRALYFGG